MWEALHIAHAFELAGQVDLLHSHFDFLPLTYSRLVDVPVVTTVHGFSSPRIVPAYTTYDDHVAYVAISDADRHPDLAYAATVHHGIDLAEFTFQPAADGPLVILGRVHPDKGVAEAIEVALHIDGDRVRYLGSVRPAERDRLLGDASGLLHLVNFNEPFGLSMVEAMACGTPVIATRRGAVPEVVAHGETGFVIDDLDTAVAAVGRLCEIDRSACRRRVETCFSVERMVQGYRAVYRSLLA